MSKNPSVSVLLAVVVLSALVSGSISYAIVSSQHQQKVGIINTGLWLVTFNDTTANRALNTTYQNVEDNGGQAMIIQIELGFLCNSSTTQATALLEVNQTAAFLHNSTLIQTVGCSGGTSSTNYTYAQMQVTMFVPWRFYYRVNSTVRGAGSTSIQRWFESIPPTGFGMMIATDLQELRRFF
jgi:hypothetical protein